MIKINNIPEELKALNQWVLWRYEQSPTGKWTKPPYHHSGKFRANHSDNQTWGFFEEVLNTIDDPVKTAAGDWQGIGFVVSDNDPYVFIDLDKKGNDDLKNEIMEKFKGTYIETSPSGEGWHIFCKTSIPSFKGNNRNGIEIYYNTRYATFTGNCETVYPILQMDEEVQWLLEKLDTNPQKYNTVQNNMTSDLTDQTVVDFIVNSPDCDEFLTLWNGGLHGLPSNSEAMFRLCSMLASRCMDRVQVERIYRQSQLFKNHNEAKPDKYRTRYFMDRTLDNIFQTLTPAVKFDFTLKEEIQVPQIIETTQEITNVTDRTDLDYDWKQIIKMSVNEPLLYQPVKTCGGMLGDLVNYFYLTAGRPSYEISLVTAIGLMAGIFGKSYNIDGSGLNHYAVVIARAGRGKNIMTNGTNYLMEKVYEGLEKGTPNVLCNLKMASGQALIKHLAENNHSQVWFSSEFGHEISESLDDTKPTGRFLRKQYLDLYSQSGRKGVLSGISYSDKKDNVGDVKSPAFTVCGESTHDSFYEKLQIKDIESGFISRLTILHSKDDKPLNNELAYCMQPSPALIGTLREMLDYTKNNLEPAAKIVDVMYSKEARDFFRKVDREITEKENILAKMGQESYCAIWTRVLEKTKRLASLIAIGYNYINPVIQLEHAEYAYNMVYEDAKAMDKHFRNGGGTSSNWSEATLQIECLRQGLKEYIETPYSKIKSYSNGADWLRLWESNIIPAGYLSRRISKLSPFVSSKVHPKVSMKLAVDQMIAEGTLYKVSQYELDKLYGKINKDDYSFSGECWIIDKSQL